MDKLGWNGHRGQLYMTGVKGKSGRKKGSLNKKTLEKRRIQQEYNKDSATSPENVPTAICATTSDPSESKEAK